MRFWNTLHFFKIFGWTQCIPPGGDENDGGEDEEGTWEWQESRFLVGFFIQL